MPDICMCTGKDCPKRNNCYRAQADPCEQRQAWFVEPPKVSEDCDYYWPLAGEKDD